jgi:hypothetical protein
MGRYEIVGREFKKVYVDAQKVDPEKIARRMVQLGDIYRN